MPEQPEGSPVGTADMHGGGVTFKDRDGNDVSFEIVRLGTSKELETVKGALADTQRKFEDGCAHAEKLVNKLAMASNKTDAANEAYKAEKEAREDSNAERGRLNGLLESEKQGGAQLKVELTTARDDLVAEQKISAELRVDNEQLEKNHANLLDVSSEHLKAMRFERDAAIGEKEALSTSCDNFKRALESARAELEASRIGHEAAKAARQAALDANASLAAELENLRTVKASLEETNTALEVSEKHLSDVTKANQDHIDAHVVLTSELGTARGELNVSRQALADIKAELLTEGDRFKTILDTLAEKIVGE